MHMYICIHYIIIYIYIYIYIYKGYRFTVRKSVPTKAIINDPILAIINEIDAHRHYKYIYYAGPIVILRF